MAKFSTRDKKCEEYTYKPQPCKFFLFLNITKLSISNEFLGTLCFLKSEDSNLN